MTYLALTSHAHTRRSQSDHLRAQAAQLNLVARDSLAPVRRDPFPPLPAEHPHNHTETVIEAAKDRWNAEIEGAVRWAQTRDWAGWEREAIEVVPEAGRQVGVVAGRVGGEVGEGVKHLGEGVKHLGEEAKGVVERGVERGRDMVGRARARAKLAEERFEAKMDAKVLHLSDVERALAERFEKREEDTRTVQEVLAGRYRPIGEKDHSRLRGI